MRQKVWMGEAEELDKFIKAAKGQGAQDEFLVAMLREKGWAAKEIYLVLARCYAESTGLDVPEPPSRLESAREAFFHFLAFATLGMWVLAIGWVWFDLIAAWLPDSALDPQNGFSIGQISWQLASIIVAFPAFVWATRSILGDLVENPEKSESPVRRWVTNIGLFLTSLVFIGALVALFTSFLQGELTLRVALDCLDAFVLAGAVFLYYSRSLGKSRTLPPLLWHRAFAVVSGVAILLTLGFGFWLNGSPANVRSVSEDNRRLRDLYQIGSQINVGTGESSRFSPPANLGALKVVPIDPSTRRPYEYHSMQGRQYRLLKISPGNALRGGLANSRSVLTKHRLAARPCTQFEAASQRSSGGEAAEFWLRSSGRHCFDFDTTKSLEYPPNFFR